MILYMMEKADGDLRAGAGRRNQDDVCRRVRWCRTRFCLCESGGRVTLEWAMGRMVQVRSGVDRHAELTSRTREMHSLREAEEVR